MWIENEHWFCLKEAAPQSGSGRAVGKKSGKGRKEGGKGVKMFSWVLNLQTRRNEESIFLSKYEFWLKKPENLVLGMLFLTLLHLINNGFGRKRKHIFPPNTDNWILPN